MSFWSKLFSPSAFDRVAGIVRDVMPIVEVITMLTPTKADDEILFAAKQLGVIGLISALPDSRGEALKTVAVNAAQKKFPEIPAEVLARAVESAYQQMKAVKVIDK